MMDIWFRPLVWMDYRLGVLLTVILPLGLLIWALFQRQEAMQRLLIIYWRVASLLMITVYLLIPGWKVGFLSGFAARILIAISLWFWVDLNEEIRDIPQNFLKLAFTSWRWAMTAYCTLGAIAKSFFLPCGISSSTAKTAFCQVWLEAPAAYRNFFHNKPGNEGFLGFMGSVGLVIYIIYLAYFILIRLGKQGRSALEQ
ncbi:DUF3177 domain-containing protein [Pleurocapsa sp. CCALA 161]|uniref:DUF3177 family protein n=1 Tax=Pleurocapsa sp. CCALA 161 TaxID=2107688 RepID=UPI000D060D35|nr:DUF3177 domain-containing protein [Pleurocapsa sp. CCALA 161]